jgi:hypothetical protein
MFAMGNRSDIEGYLFDLISKQKIELDKGDTKFLFDLLDGIESVTSMHRLINQKFELKITTDDDDNGASQGTNQGIVIYLPKRGLSKPAVRKRIEKLTRNGLIELVDKKSLSKKQLFAVNLRRSKPYRITEYGFFCIMLQARDYPPSLLRLYWHSKMSSVFLSPYFEKKTVVRTTLPMYQALLQFLKEACSITIETLNKVQEAKKQDDRTWIQEKIPALEDELLWHAKSFALRLMVDTASKDKDKSQKSRHLLSFLAHDKKFVKLVKDTMHEILSYYGGGRLLELDKALPYERQ